MTQRIQDYVKGSDDLSIWELIVYLRKGWLWIISGAALGCIGALVFILLVPPKFEAFAYVQPAKIGFSSVAVEPIFHTIERAKLATFYNKGDVEKCAARSEIELAKNIQINQVRGSNLFLIRYSAQSSDISSDCVNLIFSKLENTQSKIVDPLLKEFKAQIDFLKKKIDADEQLLTLEGSKDFLMTDNKSVSTFLYMKWQDVSRLQQLLDEKKIQLTEPLTQPIKLLNGVVVVEKFLFSDKLLVLALGILLGFFAGLVALFISLGAQKNPDNRN